MSVEWLAAGSFERTHEVISAINRISIDAKLELSGTHASHSTHDVEEAKISLKSFLSRFEGFVREVEANQKAPVLGADPRMGLLARRFVAEKTQRVHNSKLYKAPIDEVVALIDSNNSADRLALVEALRDLRSLLEQHAHADIVGILGEV